MTANPTLKVTLWTEWKLGLPDLVARYCPFYTIVRGIGGYVGTDSRAVQEESAQIILLLDPDSVGQARHMAQAIRLEHEQEVVFLTTEEVTLERVYLRFGSEERL